MRGQQTSAAPVAARTERAMGRYAFILMAIGALAAVAGPAISYRSDVAQVEELNRHRISRDSRVYAEALSRNLELVRAELERLAERREIDLRDGRLDPEQALLDVAHHHSALFGAGVGLFDAEGRLVWSEPKELPRIELSDRAEAWSQRLRAREAAVVDVVAGGDLFLVAVPIVREGRQVGAVAGLFDAGRTVLPVEQPAAEIELLVFDEDGEVLIPVRAPGFTRRNDWFDVLNRAADKQRGTEVVLGGRKLFAAVQPIAGTGLQVALLADVEAMLAPMRRRFLLQLVVVATAQLAAVVALALFVRRTFAGLVAMERRAVEQEKLALLGTASSLIAHEVKNSLNGLNAAASSLQMGASPELTAKALKGQIDRLRHLATSLLHFGRPQPAKLQGVSLQPLLEEVVASLKALPEIDDVQVELGPSEPVRIRCDPLLLISALDNLVRNAIEAGAVARDVGRQPSPTVSIRAGADGRFAVVEVEDNAGGVSDEVLRGLFQPFVTGKPRGIGLGLSMASRAVKEQGGDLSYERRPGGSLFRLRIPRETA